MRTPVSVHDAQDNARRLPGCAQTNHAIIDGFTGRQPGSGDGRAAIVLDSVRGVLIRNSRAAEGTTTFLKHHAVTEAGLFGNNDLTKAATAMDPLPSPFASSPSRVAPETPR